MGFFWTCFKSIIAFFFGTILLSTNKSTAPLYYAAKSGNRKKLETILKQSTLRRNKEFDVNAGASSGPWGCLVTESPLIVAVNENNKNAEDIVKLLLKAGANPDVGGTWGPASCLGHYHALFWAARRGQKGIVKLLLAAGADPNLPFVIGSGSARNSALTWMVVSPLMTAIHRGHDDIVGMLLAAGADPNQPFTIGPFASICTITPLGWAIHKGYRETVLRMIKAGADLKGPITMGPKLLFRSYGPTAWAKGGGKHEIVEMLRVAVAEKEKEDAKLP